MGREIRRVPADWEHPKAQQPWGYDYTPLYDEVFNEAFADWQRGLEEWLRGEYQREYDSQPEDEPQTAEGYTNWVGRSPDLDLYRPFWPEESRTHYQVYSNVSEGTPISPPLPSPDAVVEWLVTHPDPVFGPISREAAEAFVKVGSVPSMIYTPSRGLVGGINALVED